MFKNYSVIFLNGKLPSTRIIRKLVSNAQFILCADGGANKILKYDIRPDVIIGDLDSIKRKTVKYYINKGTKIIKIPEQETTDFEKCLKYCLDCGIKQVYIMGALSTRPDHAINNFSVLKRYYKSIDLKIIDRKFEIFFINKQVDFNYKLNRVVSMMPMPEAFNIITEGLKYPLKRENLKFGKREGTLNRAEAENISIKFDFGDLLLFKLHFL